MVFGKWVRPLQASATGLMNTLQKRGIDRIYNDQMNTLAPANTATGTPLNALAACPCCGERSAQVIAKVWAGLTLCPAIRNWPTGTPPNTVKPTNRPCNQLCGMFCVQVEMHSGAGSGCAKTPRPSGPRTRSHPCEAWTSARAAANSFTFCKHWVFRPRASSPMQAMPPTPKACWAFRSTTRPCNKAWRVKKLGLWI